MTVWGSTWTVGHSVALSHVADPSELRATRAARAAAWAPGLEARGSRSAGDGPPEATAALVVARQGTPPLGPNDPAAITATVHRADYERQTAGS